MKRVKPNDDDDALFERGLEALDPIGDDALFARIAKSPRSGEGALSRRTGRRSITLYIKADIIEACQPQPGKKLRLWIEANFPKG